MPRSVSPWHRPTAGGSESTAPSASWSGIPSSSCSPAPSRTSPIPDDLGSRSGERAADHRRRKPFLPDRETLCARARTPADGVGECVTGPRCPGSAALLHRPDSGHHRAQTGGAGIAHQHGAVPHAGGSDAANRLDHTAGWRQRVFQPALDGYTGLTLAESLGGGWSKPFHPEDQERAQHAWEHAIATIGVYSLECRLRRADGVYRWWLIRGVPQRGAERRGLQLVRHLHRYP